MTCSEKEVLKADGYKVALLDFGAKNNIAQSLHKRGCEVTIYRHTQQPRKSLLPTRTESCFLTALETRKPAQISSKK